MTGKLVRVVLVILALCVATLPTSGTGAAESGGGQGGAQPNYQLAQDKVSIKVYSGVPR
jgi:hypothetical protein